MRMKQAPTIGQYRSDSGLVGWFGTHVSAVPPAQADPARFLAGTLEEESPMDREFRITYMAIPAADDWNDIRQNDRAIQAPSAKAALRRAIDEAPAWAEVLDLSDDGPNSLLGTSCVEGFPLKRSALDIRLAYIGYAESLDEKEAEAKPTG